MICQPENRLKNVQTNSTQATTKQAYEGHRSNYIDTTQYRISETDLNSQSP